MLLTNPSLVERLALPEATVISRVSHGQRDKRIDAGGRIGGRLIEQLIAGLLDVTAVEGTQIKAAVGDADHRSGHITEMLEGLGQVVEHLDPIKDCLAIGRVNGSLSPVGSLIALACAGTGTGNQAPFLPLNSTNSTSGASAMPFWRPGTYRTPYT